MTEEDQGILARLSRKLQKAKAQNSKLRKYTRHDQDCPAWYSNPCTCGLEELMRPKKQQPI